MTKTYIVVIASITVNYKDATISTKHLLSHINQAPAVTYQPSTCCHISTKYLLTSVDVTYMSDCETFYRYRRPFISCRYLLKWLWYWMFRSIMPLIDCSLFSIKRLPKIKIHQILTICTNSSHSVFNYKLKKLCKNRRIGVGGENDF